jgi:hypothetical protein
MVDLHIRAKVDANAERIGTMKRLLLTLLGIILVLGLFAAAGYTGYRVGYVQGLQQTIANGDSIPRELRPFDSFGPQRMPMHNFGFERGFGRGFDRGRFPMMGFGFFSPLMFLGQIFVLALIIAFIYWVFTRSGWQITRTNQTQANPKEPEAQA